jgi:ribosomal protein S6--L-glutamate ligase
MAINDKIIIGCEEWCAFPALAIPAIKARIDSGAKTSSLHAFDIKTFRKDDALWVSFEVHPLQNNRRTSLRCERPVHDRRKVKSSSGAIETRYVILSTLRIGDEAWDIELTLANRDTMGYRMLLGREAMQGRMIVDPELSFILGEPKESDINLWYSQPIKRKTGLKIGLLATNPDLYSNQRIIEAGEEQGHEMVFLNMKHCYMKVDAQEPEVHYRGGTILNDLDAIITRIRPSMTFYGCALARQFESMGIYTTNTSEAITQSRDKLFSLQLMLKSGIGIPTTGFASSPMDTNDLIEMVGGAPLIVKLLEGAQGKGVVLAETKKAAESVINAFKALQANLLVQEFVKEADGKDLRCFVIDGKVVASIQRQAAPGEFRANMHQGGTASVIRITPEERKLAVKAAKVLGLNVAGVDIIRSSKGPLLLEVNSSPGLEGIETATGKDIAGLMIKSIEAKVKHEAEQSE